MSIAKGSRSSLELISTTISTYAPGGDGIFLPIVNESLGSTAGLIQSSEIRPDRRNSSVRGGNLSVAGSITTEFNVGGGDNIIDLMVHPQHHLFFGLFGSYESISEAGGHVLDFVGTSALPVTDLSGFVGSGTLHRGLYVYADAADTGDCIYLVTRSGSVDATGMAAFVAAIEVLTTSDVGVEFNLGPDAGVDGAMIRVIGFYANTWCVRYSGATSLAVLDATIIKRLTGGNEDVSIMFRNTKIGSMTLTVPQEGLATLSWSLLGAKAEVGAATTDAEVTSSSDRFAGQDFMLKLIPTTAVDNTTDFNTADRPVKDFSLTINNGLDDSVFVTGERERIDIPEGKRLVSGSMTLYFTDGAEYEMFKAETEKRMRCGFIFEQHPVFFDIPCIRLTGSGTPTISGTGVMTAQYSFTGYANSEVTEIMETFWVGPVEGVSAGA